MIRITSESIIAEKYAKLTQLTAFEKKRPIG